MAQVISLAAETRSASGKGGARQTRREHKVPAVIYGHGRPAQPLTVDALALEKALTGVDPESTVIELTLDGKKAKVLIREIQRHAIRPDIIHVDFYEIRGGEKVRLKIPVHLVGTPDGVRNAGDVRDLQIPNATILSGADLTIATVVPPRAEEVAAPTPETAAEVAEPELIRKPREEEGEEGAEGETPEGTKAPEGKAPPAKAPAEPKPKEKKG